MNAWHLGMTTSFRALPEASNVPHTQPHLERQLRDLLERGYVQEVADFLTDSPAAIDCLKQSSLWIEIALVRKEQPVEMINLLMNHGATLSTVFNSSQRVFRHACINGVDPAVIECLCNWNDVKREPKFQLSDSVLEIACRSTNIRLIGYLLERLMHAELPAESNCVSAVLLLVKTAIQMDDEPFVLELLRVPLVMTALGQCQSQKECWKDKYDGRLVTIYTCTALAIRQNMSTILAAMEEINSIAVRKTAFTAVYQFHLDRFYIPIERLPLSPMIEEIASRYPADAQWATVRELFLAHRRVGIECDDAISCIHSVIGDSSWILLTVTLPDHLFLTVVRFFQPKFNEQQAVHTCSAGFCCTKEFLAGKCRCHTSNFATFTGGVGRFT